MTATTPRYELTRVTEGAAAERPEIITVRDVPFDTVMGRRGALGVGIGAAVLALTARALNAQHPGGAAARPISDPRAPYPVLNAHRRGVSALLVASAPGVIVSASLDNTLKVWSLADGALLGRLRGHTSDVLALAGSPDGRTVYSASRDGTIRQWALPDGASGTIIVDEGSAITGLAITPDGKYIVSASTEGRVSVWSLSDGRLHATLPVAVAGVQLSLSADGTTLGTRLTYQDTIGFWSMPDARFLRRSAKVQAFGSPTVLAPDQRTLLGGMFDGRVVAQNLADGTVARELTAFPKPAVANVASLALSADGQLVAAFGRNGAIAVMSLADGATAASLSTPGTITSGVFTSDGRYLITGLAEGGIVMWDLPTRSFLRYLADPQLASKGTTTNLRAHRGGITALAMDATGTTVVSASADKLAKVWSIPAGQLTAQFAGHQNVVTDVVALPSGFATASSDKSVMVWAADGAPVPATQATAGRGTSRPASGKGAGPPAATLRFEFRTHAASVSSLSLAPNAPLLASASVDQTVCLWSLSDGSSSGIVKREDPATGAQNASSMGSAAQVAFSPDGRLIAARWGDDTVRLYAAGDQRPFALLRGPNSATAMAWSADGKSLAVGRRSGAVEIWSTATGRRVSPQVDNVVTSPISTVAFTRDGASVIGGAEDGSLAFVRATDASVQAVLEVHSSTISALLMTTDGSTLVSASHDRTIRLWSLTELKELAVLEGHASRVTAADLSTDNRWLVTGDDLGVLALWDLSRRALQSYLFDAAATDSREKARSYNVLDKVTGQVVTYTMPCGSPIPPNATCTCNCVPGSLSVPRSSGGGGGGSICTCNRVCTCVPIFE